MTTALAATTEAKSNPIDMVEELTMENEWSYDRGGTDELVMEVPGRFCDFRIFVMWNKDVQALHVSCAFEAKIPHGKRRDIHDLLAMLNERLWLGHFDISADEGMPMFRHTLPLRGQRQVSPEQVEDLLDTALTECERFYPAFQFVIWGGRTAKEAMEAAIIDVMGEA